MSYFLIKCHNEQNIKPHLLLTPKIKKKQNKTKKKTKKKKKKLDFLIPNIILMLCNISLSSSLLERGYISVTLRSRKL